MTTAPTAPMFDAPADAAPRCSRLTFRLLAFFLGTFGVHNYAAGHTKKASIQLALGVSGVVLSVVLIGLPMLAAAFAWALYDLFTETKDGRGVPFEGVGERVSPITSGSPVPNIPERGAGRKASVAKAA